MSRRNLKRERHNSNEENGRSYKFDVGDELFIEGNLALN
jgi:hypothetical protein